MGRRIWEIWPSMGQQMEKNMEHGMEPKFIQRFTNTRVITRLEPTSPL